MGLLDYFTGKGQANWVKSGEKNANRQLQIGRDLGAGHLASGYNTARQDVTNGLTNARDISQFYTQTAQKGLLQGADTANRAIGAGAEQSRGNINAAYDTARGDYQTALDRVSSIYNPLMESGNKARTAYDTSIGLNGTDAAQNFWQDNAGYNPMRNFQDEQIQRAMDARSNAAGYGGSGRAGLATSRALNESASADYSQLRDRLERAANQGGQYAGQYAGFNNHLSGAMADTARWQGSSLADINQREGGALGDIATGVSRNIANSSMTQGQFEAGMNINNPVATGGLATNYYGNLASLDQGTHAAFANNGLNAAAGVSAANAGGVNNMINLGTAAAQIAMGMPPTAMAKGQSAGGQGPAPGSFRAAQSAQPQQPTGLSGLTQQGRR